MMFVFNVYLVTMRNKILDIMKRNSADKYENLAGFKDMYYIYKTFKYSKSITDKERNILKIYFALTVITLILYFSFAVMIFTIDW